MWVYAVSSRASGGLRWFYKSKSCKTKKEEIIVLCNENKDIKPLTSITMYTDTQDTIYIQLEIQQPEY